MSEDRRCGACGALVALDAEWCGQCFASLREPEREPEPEPQPQPGAGPSAGSGAASGDATAPTGRRAPYWPCAVCATENPLDVENCMTCGTPFAQVMRAEPGERSVDPDTAFRRSLVFPGLGHRAVGRGMDGLARGVLFSVSAVMALLSGITAKGTVTTIVFVVFVLASIAVYVGSAVEARNLARGGRLAVSSRTLLWILVGLIFVSVGLLGFSVVSSLRK